MSREQRLRYAWSEDIWAVHLEVRNATEAAGTLRIDFRGADHFEEYPIAAKENMRYNVCRYSADNTHLVMTLPAGMELLLFENLDRAYYTDAPAALERLEDE